MYNIQCITFLLITALWGTHAHALRGGQPTSEFPAIGEILIQSGMQKERCTGTLIAPNVVLTAAHCLINPNGRNNPYAMCSAPRAFTGPVNGSITFEITKDGKKYGFAVESTKSFARDHQCGISDVGLLVLYEKVPSSLAQPFNLVGQNTPVPNHAKIATVGYGCTRSNFFRDTGFEPDHSTAGVKRIVRKSYGHPRNELCPGDSGGPWFVESTRTVYGVHSVYQNDISDYEHLNAGVDTQVLGEVAFFTNQIKRHIAQVQDRPKRTVNRALASNRPRFHNNSRVRAHHQQQQRAPRRHTNLTQPPQRRSQSPEAGRFNHHSYGTHHGYDSERAREGSRH